MFEYSSTLEPGSVESRSGFYRVTLRVVIESRYPERDSTVPGSRYSDCYMSVTKCEHLRMGARKSSGPPSPRGLPTAPSALTAMKPPWHCGRRHEVAVAWSTPLDAGLRELYSEPARDSQRAAQPESARKADFRLPCRHTGITGGHLLPRVGMDALAAAGDRAAPAQPLRAPRKPGVIADLRPPRAYLPSGALTACAWLALAAHALCTVPVGSHAPARAMGGFICAVRARAARAHDCHVHGC